MNSCKRFLLVSLVTVISLVAIDFVVGKIGDYAMTKIPDHSGHFAKDNYRLNRMTDDIAILGSSRGAHHYVSSMLSDSINRYTGKSYSLYNAAIPSKYINSNSCAAESIMGRYSPRLIIFEVSQREFNGEKALADMEYSIAHYHTNPYVRKYLDNLGVRERIKCASNMFRYNTKLLRIASAFFTQPTEINGYEPLFATMPNPENRDPIQTLMPEDADGYTVDNFVCVLETARIKKIPLVVVSSPRYYPSDNNDYLEELCTQHQIPYIDMFNLDFFNEHPEYFKDWGHLNDEGAHLYTAQFFEKLKPFLPE